MADRLDAERRRELVDERDFLMKSLDDLELEHDSGGIDDESYAELHDDYTARAAAVIRTLRDGVDMTPAPAPTSPRETRRRVLVVSVVLLFAIAAGLTLALALGARLPGETSSGNSQAAATSTTNAAGKELARRITRLQKQVNANPDDYDLRLQLADAYASNADLPTAIKQWDAAITIDQSRPEAQALIGRALYLVSEQMVDTTAQSKAVTEALAAEDKAIANDPNYADAYFYRGVIEAALAQYSSSQADLQQYVAKAPGGQWVTQAQSVLSQVTAALQTPSTTVPPTTTTRKK
jgi:cytochrome c-type biogenesis protein CcmH/NrfG